MISYSVFKHNPTKFIIEYEEPISADYRVFIDNEEVPVYTCRISKMPFNRIWPGYQRPIEQTEVVSFINLVSDEPVQLEVEMKIPHERVCLRPLSCGIVPVEKEGRISVTLPKNGQFVLEGDNHHGCLFIFNAPPIKAPTEDEVTHYFGPGVHIPGKIVLQDNESVYVDKDALVFGTVFADNAKNIRIFGNGLLDGSAEERFSKHCYEGIASGNIRLYDCENVEIEGVLCRNSVNWCISFFHCFNVKINDVKVFGQWRYNTDGIDAVNSQNVEILNSFVHSFDDTIVIKGIDLYAHTDVENILTENCVLWCGWGNCCELGIETDCKSYKNIVFRGCSILRGSGTCMDVRSGGSARISDVLFENMHIEYNVYDSPQVFQADDAMEYEVWNETAPPNLFAIGNPKYWTEDTKKAWGIKGTGDTDEEFAGSGWIHDVTFRGIHIYYDERIEKINGDIHLPAWTKNCRENARLYNIQMEDVTVNGKPLEHIPGTWKLEDVENFTLSPKADAYAELAKNTVNARNQLKASDIVSFENPSGKGKRILFTGNSMTLHGVKREIGWNHNWGMAASEKEKDYVHVLMKMVQETDEDASFCICQVSDWEVHYKNGEETHMRFEAARDFDADIIIMRFVENCPKADFDSVTFKRELGRLMEYLNPSGKAKTIITTGFWRHPGDRAIREYATENNLPLVELGDLGDDDAMKAIGLFVHSGVAAHPGDLGMKKMAERIFKKID
ncbi:MAG: hypothetical protein E7408_04675 [Ruminococcaceae bacterium]|nr:hypothetical protein [Oscillospiraceae bacterium]